MKSLHKVRFTLIELLVVVAVIAMLAAMLMPALAKARERARIIVCIGNHKQMAMAMRMYADDNEGWLVKHKWYTDFAGWKGTHGWSPSGPRPLNAYLGGDGETENPGRNDAAAMVTLCPSDKGDALNSWNDHKWTKFGTSYVVQMASGGHANIGRSTSTGTVGWEQNVRFSSIEEPEYKVAVYTNSWNNNRDWASEKTRNHGQPLGVARIPTSFMDGHAENFYIWWRPSGNRPSGKNLGRDGYY